MVYYIYIYIFAQELPNKRMQLTRQFRAKER